MQDATDIGRIVAKRFEILLIKPSKYDDDGYVIRFWRGVLPSNTLSVLNGLTEAVKERKVLGDVAVEIDRFDETAEKVPIKKIIRWSRRRGWNCRTVSRGTSCWSRRGRRSGLRRSHQQGSGGIGPEGQRNRRHCGGKYGTKF